MSKRYKLSKNNTFIDFITADEINTIRINTNNEKKLIKLLHNYLKNIDNIICLDFHGVADLYDITEKIPSKQNKIIIFVFYIIYINCT